MTALVQAELLKLRTRTAAGMVFATLALVALTVAVNVPKAPLHEAALLPGVVGIGFGVPEVLIVLLGALAVTQEFRHSTAAATYLGEPRRVRVLLAKWLSLTLASIVVTIASLAVSVPLAMALISSRNADATVTPRLWQTIGAAFLVMAAYAVIGIAIGALVRNQIIAVVGVLVWMLALEQIVVPSYLPAGRWLPGGATDAFLQLGPVLHLNGRLLPATLGGLVLLIYTAAAVTLAAKLTLQRDVL